MVIIYFGVNGKTLKTLSKRCQESMKSEEIGKQSELIFSSSTWKVVKLLISYTSSISINYPVELFWCNSLIYLHAYCLQKIVEIKTLISNEC